MMTFVRQLKRPVEMRLDALLLHCETRQTRSDCRRFPVPQTTTRIIIALVSLCIKAMPVKTRR